MPTSAFTGLCGDDSGTVLLMAHRCTLSEAEEYGDFLTCPHGHYDLWEAWQGGGEADRLRGTLRECEYEEWPRGRVVFNAVNGQFIVSRAMRRYSSTNFSRASWSISASLRTG